MCFLNVDSSIDRFKFGGSAITMPCRPTADFFCRLSLIAHRDK